MISNYFANYRYDTVANLLSESVYLLALNEDVQTKLYCEVDEYAKSGEISYEDASKMEYMEMFISGLATYLLESINKQSIIINNQ